MEKQTVENKVKEIAEAMGLTYLCESWFRSNKRSTDSGVKERAARLRTRRPHAARLPLRTTRGGFSEFHVAGLRARRSVLPYLLCPTLCRSTTKEPDAQEIAERLKGLAVRFIVAVNESGFFVPVAGQINYRVAFDKMDANLCIVTLSLTLQEQAGVCFDYGL